VHAVAAVALLLLPPRPLFGKQRYGFGYAGALSLDFAIVAAPEGLAETLWRPFAMINPVLMAYEEISTSVRCGNAIIRTPI
jgi:hypothetical protein